MKSYMKMYDKLLVLILCVWYWDVTLCLGGLAWRQTPSRFSGWWQLGCQPGSQVVSKHQLGTPGLCWAKHPNKRGWPIITGLWLATAWVLGRAGHSHLSKHAPRWSSKPSPSPTTPRPHHGSHAEKGDDVAPAEADRQGTCVNRGGAASCWRWNDASPELTLPPF
jgi:hypothetical protein